MYTKIVVPLDRSVEAAKVLPLALQVLAREGEMILLHVKPPVRTHVAMEFGDFVPYTADLKEADRADSLTYLEALRRGMGDAADRCRCEVVLKRSVVDGIVDCASNEEADLIAMYTHDRKGLAKLIKPSITEKVQRKAPMEVLSTTLGG